MPDEPQPSETTREALGPQPFGAVGDMVARMLLGADPEHSSAFYRMLRTIAGSPVEAPAFQPAEVVGPGRAFLQEHLPARLFTALEKRPEQIYVGASNRWAPDTAIAYTSLLRRPVSPTSTQPWLETTPIPSSGFARETVANAPTAPVAIFFHSTSPEMTMTPSGTAIHEALHALYRLKSGGVSGFPTAPTSAPYSPADYWRHLAQTSLDTGALHPARYEQLVERMPGEAAIEALTSNMMARSPAQVQNPTNTVWTRFDDPTLGTASIADALRMIQRRGIMPLPLTAPRQ